MSAAGAVEVSVHVAATPENVFPYFTDPARYVQWMVVRGGHAIHGRYQAGAQRGSPR
jgi:uncharacterized protein YndB with AHSA1/START domain